MNRGNYGYPGPPQPQLWAVNPVAMAPRANAYGALVMRQNGTASGGTTSVGNLLVWPFTINRDTPIDRIGVSITSGAASSVGRVGVWSSNPELFFPDRLLADSGQFDQSTSGDKENVVSGFLPGGVWLWAGYVQSGAAASIRQTGSPLSPNLNYASGAEACGNAGSNRWAWRVSTGVVATDAMPQVLTAPTEFSAFWAANNVGASLPVCSYRAASR